MGSYCLTEPSSGSDAAALKAKAIRDGDRARAVRLAHDHLGAARRTTLAAGVDKVIEAKLISGPEATHRRPYPNGHHVTGKEPRR